MLSSLKPLLSREVNLSKQLGVRNNLTFSSPLLTASRVLTVTGKKLRAVSIPVSRELAGGQVTIAVSLR